MIVNVSSVHAYASQERAAAYGASKGAVSTLTRQMAVDLAKDGIRVVGVAPGSVDTPLTRAEIRRRGVTLEEAGFSRDPRALGHVADPPDIAEVVAFLASEQAAIVTGQTLIADGGLADPLRRLVSAPEPTVLDDGAVRVECLPEQGFTLTSIADGASGAEALWRREGYEPAPCRRWLGAGRRAPRSRPSSTSSSAAGSRCSRSSATPSRTIRRSTCTARSCGCRGPCSSRTATAVEARVALVRRPLVLTRRVELAAGVVRLHERVENLSDAAVPYLWGHHPCLSRATFAGGRIELDVAEALVPDPAHDPRAAVLAPGLAFDWPHAPAAAGGSVDLGLVPEAPDGRLDHACLVPARGELSVTAPRHDRRFALRWELERFPFLLLWEELGGPGGWPFWHGADTFALEFSTNPGRATADARARDRIDVLARRPDDRHDRRGGVGTGVTP